MKIVKIEREGSKYRVFFKPNFVERLFGSTNKSILFKEKGSYRPLGGTNVYISEEGEETSAFGEIESKIDSFRHKESF